MFGWIVHLYANDPADMNVRLKLAPGAIDPESQSLAVEVCATLSLFIHLIVVPTGTVTGFGE